MAEAVRKNHPNAVSPKDHSWFFRLQFLPAHINPEWHKLYGRSSSGVSSETPSKPSHPAAETSLRSAGLVSGSQCSADMDPQPHPINHTSGQEAHTPSSSSPLGFKQCGISRAVGWANSPLILITEKCVSDLGLLFGLFQ